MTDEEKFKKMAARRDRRSITRGIPAHRKRAEAPEPSCYRIFRNIPDHRMLRSMEMFRIFRRAISRMSPLRATVTSMRWDDAAWHTLR